MEVRVKSIEKPNEEDNRKKEREEGIEEGEYVEN